jgi:hypothetical protein
VSACGQALRQRLDSARLEIYLDSAFFSDAILRVLLGKESTVRPRLSPFSFSFAVQVTV